MYMTDLSKEYFDEKIGQLVNQVAQSNSLLESFAIATAQRFNELESEIREVKNIVRREETDADELKQDHRRLRDHVENVIEPRVANLEAQIG